MTVQEFVEGYNKVKNAGGDVYRYIEDRYIRDYIPQREKTSLCISIARTTSHKEIKISDKETKEIFVSDRLNRYMIFMLKLVELYTDIDFNTDGTDIMEDYEALDEYDLIRTIIVGEEVQDPDNPMNTIVRCGIPLVEYERFKMFMDMAIADVEDNENNIINFLNDKATAMSMVLDTFADAFLNKLEKSLDNLLENTDNVNMDALYGILNNAKSTEDSVE